MTDTWQLSLGSGPVLGAERTFSPRFCASAPGRIPPGREAAPLYSWRRCAGVFFASGVSEFDAFLLFRNGLPFDRCTAEVNTAVGSYRWLSICRFANDNSGAEGILGICKHSKQRFDSHRCLIFVKLGA